MLDDIEAVLRDECGLVKERPIIVGVSGGPDSLCLMEALRQCGYPIIVAHFNHQLRPEADHDALTVEKTASRLMISSVIDGADVRGYAEQNRLSIEEAARNLRYRFMFKLAHERNAQAVAVGHTADDQVETILMHFLRGTGLAGLKGMAHRSIINIFDRDIPVVRPLLDIWREETVVYCAAHGLRPHYDSSNDSLNFQRNRVRHLLIPSLETYNPKFRDAIFRLSQSLKGDHDLLAETIQDAWASSVIDQTDDVVSFEDSTLSGQSPGMCRNLVRRAIQSLRPGLDVDFAAVQRACTFIHDAPGGQHVDLKGGLRVFREAGRIHICTATAKLPFNLWPQLQGGEPIRVEVPGQLNLSGGWKVNCERWRIPTLAWEQAARNEDQFQVWLDADTLPESLELRARLPGDQFEPLGLGNHSQKLSDFMVNVKMPQRARERWPLLCSGEEILWVPGYRPAHSHRLTESSSNILYFSVSRPPDKVTE
jgi:tRNA(Ile)-lysidine synthase